MATDAQREGVRRALGSVDDEVGETVKDRIRRGNEEILGRAQESLQAEAAERGITVEELRAETRERATIHIAPCDADRVHVGGMGNGMPGPWKWKNWLTRLYPACPVARARQDSDTPSSE